MARAERKGSLHRFLGMTGAGLIAWLALTGLVLNHSADLALHERTVPAFVSERLYRAGVPDDLAGYPLGAHWAAVIEGRLYFAQRAIDACPSLRGGLQQGDLSIIACDDAVHVMDTAGNRLDRLDASWGIAGEIVGLSLRARAADESGEGQSGAATVVIHATQGAWCLDPLQGNLSDCAGLESGKEKINPADMGHAAQRLPDLAQALPQQARRELAAALSGPAVDVERLLHDLHTGRLFGAGARWVWDLFALALLALAASGVVMIRRGKRRGG